MIRLLVVLLAMCPIVAQAQGIGLLASIGPSTLTGPNGLYSDAPGWRSGLWGEYMGSPILGLYADVAYSKKTGSYAFQDVHGEYIAIGAMPRLKVQASDGLRLVMGAGGYVGVYAGEGDGNSDSGLYCSLGVEWDGAGVGFFYQRGFSDVVDIDDAGSQWSSGGFTVLVNLWKK